MRFAPEHVSSLFEAFDGPFELARAAGGLPPTTVHNWKRKSRVPKWRVATIVDAARTRGLIVTIADDGAVTIKKPPADACAGCRSDTAHHAPAAE